MIKAPGAERKLDMSTADAFIEKLYKLRSTRGRRAEINHMQEKHFEIFGDYADKDCPPPLISARVFYKMATEAYRAAGLEMSEKMKGKATAVLKMKNDFTNLDPETAKLFKASNMLYHNESETKKEKKEITKMAKTNSAENGTTQRIDCLGYPVTAVCRRLGKEGFSVAQVRAALIDNMGLSVNPATVMIQVNAGRKGQRGEPAAMTKKELAALKKHIPAEKDLKKEKPKAEKKAKKPAKKKAAKTSAKKKPAKKKPVKKVAKKKAVKKIK